MRGITRFVTPIPGFLSQIPPLVARKRTVKPAAALIISLLLGLAVLPAVLASGDVPALGCGVIGGDMGAILQTIRTLESGGQYQAQAPGSSASGAYQFIDSTWANYGGYTRAVHAPPEVQDAKAIEAVTRILAANGNDVGAVPVVWYIGHVPVGVEWNQVPFAGAGNVLTPRQYQAKWMTIYRTIAPTPTEVPPIQTVPDEAGDDPMQLMPDGDASMPVIVPGGCVGGSIEALPGGWSLPVPRGLLTLEAVRRRHHDYPAWDWGTPVGTPIYAIRAGTVTSVTNYSNNWFDAGCLRGGSCAACGIGVTITDSTGVRWTYCHGSNLTVPGPGMAVEAGTQIMWSGNTGRSTGPHLHLGIRTPDGVRRCPQSLLESLYSNRLGIDTMLLGTVGCKN